MLACYIISLLSFALMAAALQKLLLDITKNKTKAAGKLN